MMSTLRVVLGFALLFWTCAPAAAADEPAPACLGALKAQVTYKSEMTVTRVDGQTFAGWLERVNASEGTLRLKTYDPSASRFGSVDFSEREIAALTYREDTTDEALMLLFVMGTTPLGAFIGVELAGGSVGDFTNGESSVDLGVGAVGLLGGLFGLILGMVLAPKSSTEVTIDCRAVAP